MGNGMSPCLYCSPAVHGEEEPAARLVFWGGPASQLAPTGTGSAVTAGDVMAELPGDHLVCAGDAFFIGLPIPALTAGEALAAGRTYFVLPAARFSSGQALTAASLASLSPSPAAKVSLAGGASSPFEYVTGDDGMALIRVLPEFIEKAITAACGKAGGETAADQLCSTPELKKHYMQLVGRQRRPWSPGLETISEAGTRRRRRRMPSPVRLVALAKAASR
uniref:Uncharacterized protein n=1 Tax=Leersia perrieri TaxID=77586 RepID=A0A0D9WG05_9ORYZ